MSRIDESANKTKRSINGRKANVFLSSILTWGPRSYWHKSANLSEEEREAATAGMEMCPGPGSRLGPKNVWHCSANYYMNTQISKSARRRKRSINGRNGSVPVRLAVSLSRRRVQCCLAEQPVCKSTLINLLDFSLFLMDFSR